jgi:hypothetical protein
VLGILEARPVLRSSGPNPCRRGSCAPPPDSLGSAVLCCSRCLSRCCGWEDPFLCRGGRGRCWRRGGRWSSVPQWWAGRGCRRGCRGQVRVLLHNVLCGTLRCLLVGYSVRVLSTQHEWLLAHGIRSPVIAWLCPFVSVCRRGCVPVCFGSSQGPEHLHCSSTRPGWSGRTVIRRCVHPRPPDL